MAVYDRKIGSYSRNLTYTLPLTSLKFPDLRNGTHKNTVPMFKPREVGNIMGRTLPHPFDYYNIFCSLAKKQFLGCEGQVFWRKNFK